MTDGYPCARMFLVPLIAIGVGAGVADAVPTIEWQLTPALPDHVENPGGTLTAFCRVLPDDTTFERLEVRVKMPNGNMIAEWIVTESDELTIEWTMDAAAQYPDGIYTYEVDYFSMESGLSSSVSQGFLGAGATTGVCAFKYDDMDGDGELEMDDGETLLEGWEICYESGPEDIGCQFTDENGVTCWFFISPGDYTLCETLQPEWESTTGVCADVTVKEDAIAKVEFGNTFNPVPVEERSWGQIKSSFD